MKHEEKRKRGTFSSANYERKTPFTKDEPTAPFAAAGQKRKSGLYSRRGEEQYQALRQKGKGWKIASGRLLAAAKVLLIPSYRKK